MKTVQVTNDQSQSAARRRALAAALAQQGGLSSTLIAAPAVAGAKGLALALGSFGVSAAEGSASKAQAGKR